MTAEPSARYLEMQVLSATPEQLLLLLFDGAVRFAEQGREAQAAKEFERSTQAFKRAQDILIELMSALDRSIGDDLYGRLIGLYQFCWTRLFVSSLTRNPAAADDALKILRSLRETWVEAVGKTAQERRGPVVAAAPPQGGFSVTG